MNYFKTSDYIAEGDWLFFSPSYVIGHHYKFGQVMNFPTATTHVQLRVPCRNGGKIIQLIEGLIPPYTLMHARGFKHFIEELQELL